MMAWGTALIGKKGGLNGAAAFAVDVYSLKKNVLKLKWTSKKTFAEVGESVVWGPCISYGGSHAIPGV